MNTHQSPTNPHAAGKAAHTAGPWKASGFTIYATPEKRSFGGPEREYLRPVCSMEPGETAGPEYLDRSSGAEYNERLPGDAEAHANAAFIVRACNSHAALVEAVERLLNQVTGPAQVYGDGIGNDGRKTGLSHWEFNELKDERIAFARAALQSVAKEGEQ